MSKHIAFKCTYNDGDQDEFVGYSDICSNKTISRNIRNGRVWCNQSECRCNEYYYNNFRGERPVSPCYESGLFRDWEYGAGVYHSGEREGEPIHILQAAEGRIAIFTTRFPLDDESERKIIGFFRIERIENLCYKETFLYGNPKTGVRFPLEVAQKMYFWDYHNTKGGARWGTGLFRYLDNDPVATILYDASLLITDIEKKKMIHSIIKEDLAPNKILREKKIV